MNGKGAEKNKATVLMSPQTLSKSVGEKRESGWCFHDKGATLSSTVWGKTVLLLKQTSRDLPKSNFCSQFGVGGKKHKFFIKIITVILEHLTFEMSAYDFNLLTLELKASRYWTVTKCVNVGKKTLEI